MSGSELGLAISVFLACTVEAVEALTIVLAVGASRHWPSAMGGVGAALAALAALVAALGPALTALPIDALRLLVGGLLLTFGLQWLGKAILRAAGLKAKHDELQTYDRETAAARAADGRRSGFDGYSFAIAFKGVLLEGLEVVFIVLTFGANQHRVGLAAAAAALALLFVALAGALARAPLASLPENTMKLAVGVMLSSFGMFWGAEGAGAHWPGGDAALLAILPGVSLTAIALASIVRLPFPAPQGRPQPSHVEAGDHTLGQPHEGQQPRRVAAVMGVIWEFVAGEDWRTAIGVTLGLALTALIAAADIPAWWTMPSAVLSLLALSMASARSRASA